VHSIQHYVIKFVSDLLYVDDFLRFPPPIKLAFTNLNEKCTLHKMDYIMLV
jgi:hypothetical protein